MQPRLTIFLLACLFTACTESSKTQEPSYTPINLNQTKTVKKPGYYCPMECEGDKTYADSDTVRLCPDCKMKLVHTK